MAGSLGDLKYKVQVPMGDMREARSKTSAGTEVSVFDVLEVWARKNGPVVMQEFQSAYWFLRRKGYVDPHMQDKRVLLRRIKGFTRYTRLSILIYLDRNLNVQRGSAGRRNRDLAQRLPRNRRERLR